MRNTEQAFCADGQGWSWETPFFDERTGVLMTATGEKACVYGWTGATRRAIRLESTTGAKAFAWIEGAAEEVSIDRTASGVSIPQKRSRFFEGNGHDDGYSFTDCLH